MFSLLYGSILTGNTWLLGKPYLWLWLTMVFSMIQSTFVGKVMSPLFNTLVRFVIAFLPRSKCLNFMATITTCSDFGAQENKSCHSFHFFPFYLPWMMGLDARISIFGCWVSGQFFHSLLSPSSRGSLIPLHLLSLEWYNLYISSCSNFSWQSWFQLVLHPAQLSHDVLCTEVK